MKEQLEDIKYDIDKLVSYVFYNDDEAFDWETFHTLASRLEKQLETIDNLIKENEE
jgi:hypothetical protein